MEIAISMIRSGEEVEQIVCGSESEAGKKLDELNASAGRGVAWRLSESNFWRPDGVPMNIHEANAVRRACGVTEH